MRSEYKIIKRQSQLNELIEYCKQTGFASIDFETNGDDYANQSSYPTILGVSFQPGGGWIIPLAHKDSKFRKSGRWKMMLKKFGREVISNPEITKIAWNLKFEYKWFKKYGINMRGRLLDGMLAKYLLKEERPNGLKEMVAEFLTEYAGYDLKGQPSSKANRERIIDFWSNVNIKELSKYCALDCDLTFRLMIYFESMILKHKFNPLFRNMLMMGTRVLGDSEFHGMPVDVPYLNGLVSKYQQKINLVEHEIRNIPTIVRFNKALINERIQKHIDLLEDELVDINKIIKKNKKKIKKGKLEEEEIKKLTKELNSKLRMKKSREETIDRYISRDFKDTKKEKDITEPVNFGSPNQMVDLLYKSKKGFRFKVIEYTTDKYNKPTDTPSTAEDILLQLKKKDKTGFIEKLLEYRGLTKLYSTYILGMKEKLSDRGYIHAGFLLHGTVTGRLSSRGPNLQNIPRDTTASDIKKMFIPPKGKVLLQLDYSQAELRVMAAAAGETNMIEWFRSGRDIHLAVACKKYKWDYDERNKILSDDSHKLYTETKIARKQAKTINFGIIYGQSAYKLAEGLSDYDSGLIIDVKDAEIFLEEYNKMFPKIAKFIKKQHKFVKENGYVRNLFGRKRRLWNITSDNWAKKAEAQRQSVNAPIQGAASDYTLFSSIIIWEKINKGELPRDMIQAYTVHDSLGYFLDVKDVKRVVPILEKICENPETKEWFGFQIDDVQMKVDFEITNKSWGDLHDYKSETNYIKLYQAA